MAASSIFTHTSNWQNNYNTHHDALNATDKSKADDVTGNAYGAVNESGANADAKLKAAWNAYDHFSGSGAAKKDLFALVEAAQLGHDQNSHQSGDTLKKDLEAAFGTWADSQGKNLDQVTAADFAQFKPNLGDDIKNNPTFQQTATDVSNFFHLK